MTRTAAADQLAAGANVRAGVRADVGDAAAATAAEADGRTGQAACNRAEHTWACRWREEDASGVSGADSAPSCCAGFAERPMPTVPAAPPSYLRSAARAWRAAQLPSLLSLLVSLLCAAGCLSSLAASAPADQQTRPGRSTEAAPAADVRVHTDP